MTARALILAGVVLVGVLLAAGCAATLERTALVDGRRAPRTCPDGAPVRVLQDPACGRHCGYSCLPDRWKDPTR